MKKVILFLVVFGAIIFAVASAEILYGPYGVDEGLQKYQEIAQRKVYHLGDDNALKDFVGQCTWFCYATTKERMPTGNAHEWYDSFAGQYPDRVGSEPKVGAICVWESCLDYSVNGHVAKVTKVFSDGSFIVWEANFKTEKITCRKVTSRDNIKGFIYPQGVDMTAAPEQVSTDADSAEATKPFTVVKDDCYPASFAEVLPSGKVWVVFSNIVDKKVTADNFNKYVQFTTELRSTTYLKREDEDGRTTFYFYSKFWVPGDRIKIKILKDLKDINGHKLGKDYTMSFCLHNQELISTGPKYKVHKIIKVYAKNLWTDTGVDLRPGDYLYVRAWGKAMYAPQNGYLGPEGLLRGHVYNRPCYWNGKENIYNDGRPVKTGVYFDLVPAPQGALIAKLNNNDKIVYVGKGKKGKILRSGRFLLGINDDPPGLWDNDGYWEVEIIVK